LLKTFASLRPNLVANRTAVWFTLGMTKTKPHEVTLTVTAFGKTDTTTHRNARDARAALLDVQKPNGWSRQGNGAAGTLTVLGVTVATYTIA
jgi:hypothetical protein